MPIPSSSPKRVAAGRLNAEKRWGHPPHTVKIGDLSPEAQRLIRALVDAAKKAPAPAKADAQEVDRVGDHTTRRAA